MFFFSLNDTVVSKIIPSLKHKNSRDLIRHARYFCSVAVKKISRREVSLKPLKEGYT